MPPAAVAAGTVHDIDSASSLTVVVNKHRPPDPQTYVPKSLTRIQAERVRTEAAKAHQQLVKTAKSDGVDIVAVSGCRSCSTQAGLCPSGGSGRERDRVALGGSVSAPPTTADAP